MTSKERLNKLVSYSRLWLLDDEAYNRLYNEVVEDLEILDLFKKYFAGVVQEKETGRFFIHMKELENGDDLEVFLKLFREKLFKE